MEDKQTGLLFVVSGPAGSGKTTLCDRLLETYPESIKRVVTTTTREPREGEVDGVDYHFISYDDFQAKVDAGEFYEFAHVHTNTYGSQKKDILGTLDSGKNILLNIDIQGAASFRKAEANDPLLKGKLVSIFVSPDTIEALRERLTGRGTDDNQEIERRMQTAAVEMKAWGAYNYYIRSKTKEEDFEAIKSIYQAERMRVRKG